MKINVERMRYKNDSLSFWMCIFGLVFNVIQFIQIYANCYLQTLTGKEGFNYWIIGVDILYNILLILIAFYMAEELKTYHIRWTAAALIVGILQIVRIGIFPRIMFENEFYGEALYTRVKILYVLSALSFVAAAVIAFVKSTMLRRFLRSKGEL